MLYFFLVLSLILVLFLFIIAGLALLISISSFISLVVTRVAFVPTPPWAREKVLKMIKINPGDRVFDLGAGDAKFLIEIEKKFKAQTYGFEISLWPYLLAWWNIFLKKSKTKIFLKNFYKADLSQADFIFCFLGPGAMEKLKTQFRKQLKKEAKIISYSFPIKSWVSQKIIPVANNKRRGKFFIYQI